MAKAQRPEILRGVFPGKSEVRFTYTAKDGGDAYVSGHMESFVGTPENIQGIKVRLGVNARYPGKSAGDILACKLDRIHPDEDTGLIIPVSKKELAEGTGAAQFIRPRDKQVAYAIDLAAKLPEGTAVEQHTDEEFRAMSRKTLSEWIDDARFEIRFREEESGK